MTKKIKAGIVGGAGYTGGELIRLLLDHPNVEIGWAMSHSQNGKKISDVHFDLLGITDLSFQKEMGGSVDVIFICAGHGKTKEFLAENEISDDVVLIDLSRDYRLKADAGSFVYGLCELNKEKIKKATRIANCGCFATCIQLGLLPAAREGWLNSDIHVNAITGSTGAGQSKLDTTHFSWRNNNVSVYKAFRHQHMDEILESIQQEAPAFDQEIHFLPVRGDFTRGIYASMYFKSDLDLAVVKAAYQEYYKESPFVFVTDHNPSLKEVVNTNKAHIYIDKIDDKILIVSMIDNLLKGASGQAVQNMNLIFDLDETSGLKLKATVY